MKSAQHTISSLLSNNIARVAEVTASRYVTSNLWWDIVEAVEDHVDWEIQNEICDQVEEIIGISFPQYNENIRAEQKA